MIFFSDRLRLETLFQRWARSQNPRVKECPCSVIGYLEGHGLLNEEKVKEFLKEHKEENQNA